MATDPFTREFGRRIEELREQRGWSRRQLALRLEIHPAQVTRYESGDTSPSLPVLAAMAGVFNVSTDEILFGAGSDPTGGFGPLFHALADFTPEEKRVVKSVLEALIAQHDRSKRRRKKRDS